MSLNIDDFNSSNELVKASGGNLVTISPGSGASAVFSAAGDFTINNAEYEPYVSIKQSDTGGCIISSGTAANSMQITPGGYSSGSGRYTNPYPINVPYNQPSQGNVLIGTTTSTTGWGTIVEKDKDSIKSDEKETSEHGHKIQGQLCIEFDKVVVKFRCSECDEVISEKVIFRLPKKVKKAKCLPRIVKQV